MEGYWPEGWKTGKGKTIRMLFRFQLKHTDDYGARLASNMQRNTSQVNNNNIQARLCGNDPDPRTSLTTVADMFASPKGR